MSRDLATAMVLLSYTINKVAPALKELREQGKRDLVSGERVAAVGPDGTVYGYITRTKATVEPVVVDEAQLMAHLQDTRPDALIEETFVPSDRYDEMIAVLREHAPHLLETHIQIEPRVLRGLLSVLAHPGLEMPPGVEQREKPGTVNVYPNPEKAMEIEYAVQSGLVSFDGTLRRIEGEQ